MLAANFWVGILRNTYNDLSSAVGVPQHDFYQYYAGGHNWNLGLDPYLNYPDDSRVIHQPRMKLHPEDARLRRRGLRHLARFRRLLALP